MSELRATIRYIRFHQKIQRVAPRVTNGSHVQSEIHTVQTTIHYALRTDEVNFRNEFWAKSNFNVVFCALKSAGCISIYQVADGIGIKTIVTIVSLNCLR